MKILTASCVVGIPLYLIVQRWFENAKFERGVSPGVRVRIDAGVTEVGIPHTIALRIIRSHLQYLAPLKGLNYLLWIRAANAPVRPGIASMVYRRKDWPWSKPAWIVETTALNEGKATPEWWFHYTAHELFGHVAYVESGDSSGNQNEQGTTFLGDEIACKDALNQLLPPA